MHPDSLRYRREEIVLIDPENRWSICQLVPEALAHRIRQLWESEDRFLLRLTENKLAAEARKRGVPLSTREQALRYRFWYEYDCAVDNVGPGQYPNLKMQVILGRVIPKEVFYSEWIYNNIWLAYMLNPPLDYILGLQAALARSTEWLAEMFAFPMVDGTLINMPMVKMAFQAHNSLHHRVTSMVATVADPNPKKRDEEPEEEEEIPEEPPVDPEEQARLELERLKAENEKLREEESKQRGGVPVVTEDLDDEDVL